MKDRATLCVSLIAMLALSLSVSTVYGKIGFAVSKYEVDLQIVLGSVENVTFARIYNTGDETLVLKASVQQSSLENGTLSLKLLLEKAELKPDENCLVKMEVDATNETGTIRLGNYTVQVEISPSVNAPSSETGGAVLPSASVDGNIMVYVEEEDEANIETDWWVYPIAGAGLGFVSFLGITWWKARNAAEQKRKRR